jgi:hypothetical protein
VTIDGEKKTLERRWYLRPGHAFQFNRQSIKKYGGVVLTHRD